MTTPLDRARLRTAAALLAAGSALALSLPATAQADTAYLRRYPNVATQKCMEVADWRTDDGAPVRQWTCTGGDNQMWEWGAGVLVNVHSQKCLEIPGFSTVWGTQAQQWTCNGGANQQWRSQSVPLSGTSRVFNVNSGLVLDVAGADPADGAPVIQWEYTGAPNQSWGRM